MAHLDLFPCLESVILEIFSNLSNSVCHLSALRCLPGALILWIEQSSSSLCSFPCRAVVRLEIGSKCNFTGPHSMIYCCFILGVVSCTEASWSKSTLENASPLSFRGKWDMVWLCFQGIFWQCWSWGEKQGRGFKHEPLGAFSCYSALLLRDFGGLGLVLVRT